MSRTPEEDAAYLLGVEEGTERGTIVGMTQAWLEVQAWAQGMVRSVPRYGDPRHLNLLADLVNNRLLQIGSPTPPEFLLGLPETGRMYAFRDGQWREVTEDGA